MPVCKTKEHGPQIKLVLKKAEHISVLCKYKSKSFIFLDDWMIGILVRCIYSTLEVSCLGQLIFMFSGMSEERMCVCVCVEGEAYMQTFVKHKCNFKIFCGQIDLRRL